MLHGLHAAHEARGRDGEPLDIIHRDVSPQNVLVGDDGVARVIDFGVAKARGRLQTTAVGQFKGKPAYMAPEQWQSGGVTRQVDIYAAGLVLREALTLERTTPVDPALPRIEHGPIPGGIPPVLRAIIAKALSPAPEERFTSAQEMALALEAVVAPATASSIAEWVTRTAGAALAERAHELAELDAYTMNTMPNAGSDAQGTTPVEVPLAAVRRRAWAWLLPAGALALVGTCYAVSRSPHVEPAPLSASASASASVSLDVAPSAEAVAAPTAPVVVAPSASVKPKARPSRPLAVAPPPPRPTTPEASCNPPYIVDESGRRVYKRSCFH